jgi:Uma2 family endonuclease
MATTFPSGYCFDPSDPRAPTEAQWASMSPAERARVIDMLPSEPELGLAGLALPEGDVHRKVVHRATDTLDAFFRRTGRKVYVSSGLMVYYPGERCFAPDVLAVVDVEPGERSRWVVQAEGKGLGLALEVHYLGDRAKDFEDHVARYARLGIHEYFVFDRRCLRLRGLPEGSAGGPRAYRPIVPQAGRLASEVLGLDLALDGARLRFLYGNAPLPDADELIAKLGGMLDDVILRQEEAEQRAAAEAERAAAEAERAAGLEERLAEAQARLAELAAEVERLRRR